MNNADVNHQELPILTYHSIDDSRSVVSTSPRIFHAQMRYLKESGYNVISIGEIVAHFHEGRPLPAKTVAIGFDDGYKNVYMEAHPILQQYGFRATVFLIADYCGKDSSWPGNSPSLAHRPLLSWREVKAMQKCGIEFGAHTLTHPDLTRLSPAQAEHEIAQSKDKITHHLGEEVSTFAYPYGLYNLEVKRIVQAHFRGACSTLLGKVNSNSDPYLLRRIDMYYLSHPSLFKRLPTRSLTLYLQLRQALRTVRGLLSNGR
jgi:peptidoglycan/xylan/chitin deacetylase (PgdA/CDA1 family)